MRTEMRSKKRMDYTMRTLITAMAIASLAVTAPLQALAKGKRQQQDAPKAEDQTKNESCGRGVQERTKKPSRIE
jgi:hypothetical protein